MRRRTAIILLAACAAIAVAGASARLSSAAFTAQKPVAGNTVTVDKLGNYFQVTPGTAVQAGTSIPVATGNVDTLALAFSLVPSARAFTSVFTVKNISTQSRTAVLTLSGPAQVVSALFASTGTTSATLAAGASTTVTVTTSSTVAGHGVGSLRLGLSSLSWMYRTYALTLDEAPEAPPSLTAGQRPAGRIDLAWGASSTTTGLKGYDVYRKTGAGSYAKLNASTLTGLTYSDTTTTNGTTYTYKVNAVSTDATPLTSLDSPAADADGRRDASGPADRRLHGRLHHGLRRLGQRHSRLRLDRERHGHRHAQRRHAHGLRNDGRERRRGHRDRRRAERLEPLATAT